MTTLWMTKPILTFQTNTNMQTTLFEVMFYDGRRFNIFCANKKQIDRLFKFISKNLNEIMYWKELSNGIHTVKEFEQINTVTI